MAANVPTLVPVLVYDGDCGFCTKSVLWGRRHLRRMTPGVPYQSADLVALGLTEAQCATAVQYVARDRHVLSGADAVAATLLAAGKGWWVLGAAMHLPGVHWLMDRAYRWVARNRHRLGRGPATCAVGVPTRG